MEIPPARVNPVPMRSAAPAWEALVIVILLQEDWFVIMAIFLLVTVLATQS